MTPLPTHDDDVGSALDRVAESALRQLEKEHPHGITSALLLEFLASRGVHFKEATLRKWVQLGLLPRSVRVGQKGKHRGSKGLYPVRVVRRILSIKKLMAGNLTIEEIQGQFLFVREDIEALEHMLVKIFGVLETLSRQRGVKSVSMQAVAADMGKARSLAADLIERLERIEQRFISRPSQIRSEVAAS